MKKTRISDFWFYKYRYQIGIGILALGYAAIIYYTLFIAPNGLTQAEIESAKNSANLNFSNIFSKEIIDFPYRILQKISIGILGLSNFSIKLPSILISLFCVVAITKLARIWFPRRTSILAAIIAITSSQFFFIAQNGTSEILYILYPIILILSGFNFLKTPKKRQLAILVAVLGLSFYTPLSIYIALALIFTVLAHPHLRFTFKKFSKKKKLAVYGALIAIILPLAVSVIANPSIAKTILGIPSSFNIFENIKNLGMIIFGFKNPISNGLVSPILSPVAACLVLIGAYFILIDKHSARGYLIIIWTLILLCVCVLNPAMATILFVPILILTIAGLQGLIDTWYALFPQNPYARFIGLIPVSLLVINILTTNLSVFSLSYTYSPETLSAFNQDLKILLENTDKNRILMVSKNETGFFEILQTQKSAKITTDFTDSEIILSREAFLEARIPANYKIEKILTSARADNSDRFYILKKK